MADPFTILLTGDILTAVLTVFTNVMQYWFYAVMLLGFEIILYLKTENITMVAITSGIVVTAMTSLIPTAGVSFAIVVFLLVVAAILWKVFH